MARAELTAIADRARLAQAQERQAEDARVPAELDPLTAQVLALIDAATAPLIARIVALEGRASGRA